MKWILFAAVLLLAALASLAAQPASSSRVSSISPALAEHAARRIFATGRVEGQTREVEVHATLSERVARVLVHEGERVRQGQLLIELDDASLVAEERLAAAGLTLARSRRDRLVNGPLASEIEEARSIHQARMAECDGARQTLDRFRRLRAGGAASVQSIDEAEVQLNATGALMLAAEARLKTLEAPPREDELAAADAEIAVATARLDYARAMRAKTAVRAPRPGQILQINVEEGELASPEMSLVVMCDDEKLRVRADVDELDALQVTVGQPATITSDGLADLKIHGRIAHIRPRLNNKRLHSDRPGERLDSRIREVWIDLIRPPALVIGLPVDVSISAGGDPTISIQQAARTASHRRPTLSPTALQR